VNPLYDFVPDEGIGHVKFSLRCKFFCDFNGNGPAFLFGVTWRDRGGVDPPNFALFLIDGGEMFAFCVKGCGWEVRRKVSCVCVGVTAGLAGFSC